MSSYVGRGERIIRNIFNKELAKLTVRRILISGYVPGNECSNQKASIREVTDSYLKLSAG